MKITEFRIGNWVNDETNTMPYQIRPEDILPLSNDENKDKANSIPLTPEIFVLNGCGEDNNGHFLLDLGATYLEIIPSVDGYYPVYGQKRETSGDPDSRVALNRINYVHQYQNLYFTLTGEELNIDL